MGKVFCFEKIDALKTLKAVMAVQKDAISSGKPTEQGCFLVVKKPTQ